jgi:hypothetical protein
MVVAHWIMVLDAEASASRSLGVVLESLVVVLVTKGATLALASVADSSVMV